MDIDSARELKAQLRGEARARDAASPALGISPQADGVAIAVRVETLAGSEAAIARIEQRCRGEVDVRETGPIRALAGEQERVRPLLPGFSVAHVDVTAGTIGAIAGGGLLSNNHVLADEDGARPGDAVLQPGPADGGGAEDRIGELIRAVALSDTEPNLVDAALASVEVDATPGDYGELGTLSGVLEDPAEAGAVAKRGRTTGITRGRVTAFELDGVQVGYTRGTLVFDDQIEIEGTGSGPFSQGGDSGSLILTAEPRPRAVGLLFAGSESGLTFANPIAAVLRLLDVSL